MRKVKVKTQHGEEIRYYLTDDEKIKYQRLGFTIKEGPRGGHYILEDDYAAGKKKIRDIRRQHKLKDDDREKELDELLDMLIVAYKGKDFEEALSIVDEIKGEYYDLLSEKEINYLNKIEDRIIRRGSNDVLGIELSKTVDSSRKNTYKRISRYLGVLSNFRTIDSITYIKDNTYNIKVGKDEFDVKYNEKGNVEEIWYYDGKKKYKGREGIVRWLSKSKGKELENIWSAFAKTYKSKKEGNKEIIEIKRKNSLINKIEKVTPSRGRGDKKIKWLMFIMIKSKEMGIAVKGMDDVIKLLNSEGIQQMIMEMFSSMKK